MATFTKMAGRTAHVGRPIMGRCAAVPPPCCTCAASALSTSGRGVAQSPHRLVSGVAKSAPSRRVSVAVAQSQLAEEGDVSDSDDRDSVEPSSSAIDEIAERLAAFYAVLGEGRSNGGIEDSILLDFLGSVPGLLVEEPATVCTKLEQLSGSWSLHLSTMALFFTHVPDAWERPVEALVDQMARLGVVLGCSEGEAANLIGAVPPLFNIRATTIIKDKLDALALRLGLPLLATVQLVTRQPLLWAVPPQHIQSGVPRLCNRLGLTTSEAQDLIARVPPILVLDEVQLQLQVGPLAATLHAPPAALIELLGRCLGLVSVPPEVLGSNLANLAAALGVQPCDALELATRQPALLAAQLPALVAVLEALQAGLALPNRLAALRVLLVEPALMGDTTEQGLTGRLESLAAAFQMSVAELRALAAQQPTLLVVAPSTIRAALAKAAADPEEPRSPADCLQLLLEDPGAFIALGYSEEVMGMWPVRLGLDPGDVEDLVDSQPALLELSPNTVKARLESLAALFGIPLRIAAQLVRKNPALATIPPNVVITRVKSLALALGQTMQTVGVMVAKSPAVLACAVATPGELNRDLKPYAGAVQEVTAAYEYYTMEWLSKGLKEVAPSRVQSFSSMDRR